jgi:serine/threonine-protein kinase
MIAQVCDGLDYAHNLTGADGKPLGLVHRDISPVNIIVSNKGAVKLIDFGLVKIRTSGEGQTAAGMIKGKFAYLAPEYMRGQLDHRADIFGLGAIAHELLTGRRLFHARTDLETISNITELPIQPPSRWAREVTRDVDDIVLTALHDPGLRWQSAKAMGAAIHAAMRTANVTTGPAELFKWVEWAFTQVPKPEDSHLVRVIDMLEEGTTGVRELSDAQRAELHAYGGTTPTPTPTTDVLLEPPIDDKATTEHRSLRPTDPRLAATVVPPDGGVQHKANPFADTLAAPSRGPSSVRTLPLGHAVIPPRQTAQPAAPTPSPKPTPAPPPKPTPAPSQKPALATVTAVPKRPQAPDSERGWLLWIVVIVVMACAGAGVAYAVFVM